MLDVDTSLSRSELEDQSIVHSPPNVSERDSKASGAVQESDLSEVDLRYNSSEEFGLVFDTSPSRSELQDQSIVHSPPNVPAERDSKASGAVQESLESDLSEVDLQYNSESSEEFGLDVDTSPSRSELQDQSIVHSPPNVPAESSGAVQESVLSPSRSELEDQSIGHSTPNVLDVPAERDAKASGAVQESEQSEVDLLHSAVLHFPLNDN